MLYLSVLFLMFLCVYAFDYKKHKRLYSFSYWGFFIILVLIAGLRYRIGTDSIVYESDYQDFPTIWELWRYKFSSFRYEPGFIIFASIPRSISSDFTLLQFFQSIVVNLVIFLFIKQNTSHRFLALSLYFLALFLNLNTQVMREALSVSVFLLAWPFFRDGKWLWYYLLCLLASTFHTSAFVTFILPLFCIPGIKEAFKLGWRTLFIGIGILAVGYIISVRFKELFMLISVNERMAERVNEYASDDWSGSVLNPIGMLNLFFQFCFYPLMAIYFMRYKVKNYGNKIELSHFSRLETLVMVGVYFSLLSIPVFIMARYFNYFGMYGYVLISSWVSNKVYYKKKKVRVKPVYWLIILIPLYALIFKSYFAPANKSGTLKTYMRYYPYNSRLDPEMDNDRENIFRYSNAR